MSDFELDINISENHKIKTLRACLKYKGKDKEFIGLIEKYLGIYDKCLINLVVSIFPETTSVYTTYESSNYSPKILQYQVDAMINTFFNTTLEFYPLIVHPISAKLRGIGRVILCYSLQKIIDLGLFLENKENRKNKEVVIGLKPFGEYPGKNMKGLIDYYLDIGFKPVIKDFRDKIEDGDLDMVGNINEILKRCNLNYIKITKEMQDILKNAKININ